MTGIYYREAVARAQFFQELNISSMPVLILSDSETALDLADGTTSNTAIIFKKGRWKSVTSPANIKL